MTKDQVFEGLWKQYSGGNPSADKIRELFHSRGDRVVNDHVAFRTLDDPRVGIDVLAKPFLELGYKPAGDYSFSEKKLKARHFELPGQAEAPRVFISELLLEELSDFARTTLVEQVDCLSDSLLQDPELIVAGSVFQPLSFEVYKRLREESEYAAWVYVWGYRANHFTVSVNHLDSFSSLEELNAFLKSEGFPLNSSGGEIKGTAADFLEQSSTLADRVEVDFIEGRHEVPSCYYEFARRYPDRQGILFSGFIAGSADKIFESTDFR